MWAALNLLLLVPVLENISLPSTFPLYYKGLHIAAVERNPVVMIIAYTWKERNNPLSAGLR